MNIYLESDKPLEDWGRFLVETIHDLDGYKVTGVEPRRSTRVLFGAFPLVVVALRQQGCLLRTENPSKISPRGVRSSFWRADFRSGEEKPAGNTCVLPKALTKSGRKSAARNRCGLDSRHLKVRGVAVVALFRQDTDEDFQAVSAYQNMGLRDKQEAASIIEADVTRHILKANLRDMLDELEGEDG